jgi:hypothetical protein
MWATLPTAQFGPPKLERKYTILEEFHTKHTIFVPFRQASVRRQSFALAFLRALYKSADTTHHSFHILSYLYPTSPQSSSLVFIFTSFKKGNFGSNPALHS